MCITRGLPKRSAPSLISSASLNEIKREAPSLPKPRYETSDNRIKKPVQTPSQSTNEPDLLLSDGTLSVDSTLNIRPERRIDFLRESTRKHKRYFVQHKYIDRSEDIPEICPMEKKARGGATIPFPLKLHQMLDDIESAGLTFIVSWRSHGRAFMVHKRDEFVKNILPFYFQQNKFASFQRQLNLYGFSRISCGKDKGVYYHEMFLRGRQLLTNKMVRTKVKGNSIRGSSNPYAEPDFYSMPPLGPLRSETLTKIFDFSSNLITEHMSQILDVEIVKTFGTSKGTAPEIPPILTPVSDDDDDNASSSEED